MPPPIENNALLDEPSPGVPLFRTWRGVYGFVIACFIVVVVLLTIFSSVFA